MLGGGRCLLTFVAIEDGGPKELQVFRLTPLRLILLIHSLEDDNFEAKLGKNGSVCCRVPKWVELPPNSRRVNQLKLLFQPIVALLHVAKNVGVVCCGLICLDHATMDELKLAILDEPLHFIALALR